MYDYPLEPDWSTEEIIEVVGLYNAVEQAYEEGHIVKCDQWALVNPRIVANAVKVAYLKNGEGCLSVPEDQPGIVPRSAKVTVKGYDALTDQEVTIVARGFTAICLQHELDHFEGILYYDHFNKEDPKAPIPNAMVIE